MDDRLGQALPTTSLAHLVFKEYVFYYSDHMFTVITHVYGNNTEVYK